MKYFACTVALSVALCAGRASSQSFTTLVAFTGTGGTANGANPLGSLTLSGTTLYGMTDFGGTGYGNLFSVGTDGANYQNLISFDGPGGGTASGWAPRGSLTLSGTTLYGMTQFGGGGVGNIFSVGTNGTNFQNLVSFTGTGGTANGDIPYGSLTLCGAMLYGMTQQGGANNIGNIFSVSTGGTNFQDLLDFTGSAGTATGSEPWGSLTLAGTTLYGMTSGFAVGFFNGNMFSIGTNGTNFQNLLSFGDGQGGGKGSLTLGGTTLYGMTEYGGNGLGYIFSAGTDGTTYHNLLSFTGPGAGTANGFKPEGSLILSGTTLYGMTAYGGANGYGNIFSAGIDGSDYQDLYDFSGGADGGDPWGDLTLSGGTLFGMTTSYGANEDGTVFALTLPTPTPEPGTLVLLAAGAAGLLGYGCRRRMAARRTAKPAAFDQDAPAFLFLPSHSSTAHMARRAA